MTQVGLPSPSIRSARRRVAATPAHARAVRTSSPTSVSASNSRPRSASMERVARWCSATGSGAFKS